MKSILAAAVMALAFAGAAQAQAVTATLATPLPKPRQVIVETTIFECKDNACKTVTSNQESGTWQTCKALVRRTGPVSAFAALDPAALAKCNGEPAAK